MVRGLQEEGMLPVATVIEGLTVFKRQRHAPRARREKMLFRHIAVVTDIPSTTEHIRSSAR